jgi:hypothetical protein
VKHFVARQRSEGLNIDQMYDNMVGQCGTIGQLGLLSRGPRVAISAFLNTAKEDFRTAALKWQQRRGL